MQSEQFPERVTNNKFVIKRCKIKNTQINDRRGVGLTRYFNLKALRETIRDSGDNI